MRFVDTNILLYAISSRPEERPKAERAERLLNEPDLALSVQVLQEFYVQATRASAPVRLSHAIAVDFVDSLLRFPVLPITVDLLQAAMAIRERYRLSYWDAAIVAAALDLGCDLLLTEDLQHGQDYGGLRVENPFL